MGNLDEALNSAKPNLGEELNEDILQNMRELLGAIFIQEQRNYDMLSIIADKLGADATRLTQLHELGQVLAPAPSFIFESEEKEADQDLQDSLFAEDMTNETN
jgi:hypothetical protein